MISQDDLVHWYLLIFFLVLFISVPLDFNNVSTISGENFTFFRLLIIADLDFLIPFIITVDLTIKEHLVKSKRDFSNEPSMYKASALFVIDSRQFPFNIRADSQSFKADCTSFSLKEFNVSYFSLIRTAFKSPVSHHHLQSLI